MVIMVMVVREKDYNDGVWERKDDDVCGSNSEDDGNGSVEECERERQAGEVEGTRKGG